MEYIVLTLTLSALLGLIPANIAKNKGYSFGLWWFYGWMLFIVAIIHVQFIPDKNSPQNIYTRSNVQSVADEIKKYKELLDENVITEEEFKEKKEQLLKLM